MGIHCTYRNNNEVRMHRSQFWVLTHGWSSERLSICIVLSILTTFESLCGYITPHPALQKSSKTSSPLFQCWMSGILSHNDAIQTQNENRARGPVSFNAARGQQETSILGAPANAPSQESQKQYNQWQPVRKSVCWPGLSRNHQKKKQLPPTASLCFPGGCWAMAVPRSFFSCDKYQAPIHKQQPSNLPSPHQWFSLPCHSQQWVLDESTR